VLESRSAPDGPERPPGFFGATPAGPSAAGRRTASAGVSPPVRDHQFPGEADPVPAAPPRRGGDIGRRRGLSSRDVLFARGRVWLPRPAPAPAPPAAPRATPVLPWGADAWAAPCRVPPAPLCGPRSSRCAVAVRAAR